MRKSIATHNFEVTIAILCFGTLFVFAGTFEEERLLQHIKSLTDYLTSHQKCSRLTYDLMTECYGNSKDFAESRSFRRSDSSEIESMKDPDVTTTEDEAIKTKTQGEMFHQVDNIDPKRIKRNDQAAKKRDDFKQDPSTLNSGNKIERNKKRLQSPNAVRNEKQMEEPYLENDHLWTKYLGMG